MECGRSYRRNIADEVTTLSVRNFEDPEVEHLLERTKSLHDEAVRRFEEDEEKESWNLYMEVGRNITRIYAAEDIDKEPYEETGLPAQGYGVSDLPETMD